MKLEIGGTYVAVTAEPTSWVPPAALDQDLASSADRT